MRFSDYIINYNSQFGLNETKMIALNDVDLSEDEFIGKLMGFYLNMLKEKVERKQFLEDDETFELSGMSEDEKYIFESLLSVYVYENQYNRKQLQEDIAELSGLAMKQVEEIALANIGEIKDLTQEEKVNIAKLLTTKDEELEPNA